MDEEARAAETPPRADLLAIAALIERFQQSVGSYLLHLVGDPDVALRLAEETFVQAHRAGLATPPHRPAQSWLYRAATQLALAEQRCPPRQAEPRSPVAEDPEVVRAVLGQLPPQQRVVLLLCDLEGLTTAEVAAILGGSAERIQRRLEGARSGFRRLYLVQHTRAHPHPNGTAQPSDGRHDWIDWKDS